MGFSRKVGATVELLSELWGFLGASKKWWLGPFVFLAVLLGVFIFLSQGSAVAPFIYALF